jgi:anti-sigma B factor antagonist
LIAAAERSGQTNELQVEEVMQFEETTIQGALVVKVHESRIVADVAPQFKAGLVAYVTSGRRSIVLDLSEVTFIDSSGLGALIGSLKAMGKGGELALCSARDGVMNMLKLTRMDKVFQIFATPAAAAAALSSRNGADSETPHS